MRLIFFVILFVSNFAMATPNSNVGFGEEDTVPEKTGEPVSDYKDEPMLVTISIMEIH
jgi:hypothetical protein